MKSSIITFVVVVVCLYLHVTSAAPLVKALTNASGPAKSALSLLLSSLSFVPPWRSKVEVAEAPDSHGASRIMTQLDDLVNDMSHTYDFRRQFMKPLEAMAYEREFTKICRIIEEIWKIWCLVWEVSMRRDWANDIVPFVGTHWGITETRHFSIQARYFTIIVFG
ncbi:hypothetical protein SeLEV6574_g02646 [Synchytrium endobioticum]|uniref:Uncharacterized protein n=1 Tax=Synchytrium endobioticum TaxID=286115 RepID=A0A507D824_9FUNG|nr:hypothetical protein SeLEV6574_g02646 [Synchytrium endobioticum]